MVLHSLYFPDPLLQVSRLGSTFLAVMPDVPGELGLVAEFKLKLTNRRETSCIVLKKEVLPDWFSMNPDLDGGITTELTRRPRPVCVPLVPCHAVLGDKGLLTVRTREFLPLPGLADLCPRTPDSSSPSWPGLAEPHSGSCSSWSSLLSRTD